MDKRRMILNAAVFSALSAMLLSGTAFAGTAAITIRRVDAAQSQTGTGYMDMEVASSALFDFGKSGFLPGDTVKGSVRVSNNADQPAFVNVSVINKGDEAFFNVIKVKVTGAGSTVYFDGNLKDLVIPSLGTIAAGKSLEPVFEISFPAEINANPLYGKDLSFAIRFSSTMNDYIVVKRQDGGNGGNGNGGNGDNDVERYVSLYDNNTYYPPDGRPSLQDQEVKKGDKPDYGDDLLIHNGNDGTNGTQDDYYVDPADGHKVYPGPDNDFGTSDDRKDIGNGTNVERGSSTDPNEQFGGGAGNGYQNGNHYTNGDDKVPGTGDDYPVYPGRDGVFGTQDDYADKGDGTNIRPGGDAAFGTEDDMLYSNGLDGIPGNADDGFIKYIYRANITSGGGSGGGGSGSGGSVLGQARAVTGFYDGPMAMVSGIRGLEGGIWSKNENGRWGYSYNGNIPRNQWAYIYISSLNSSHWYYFDELGLMVVGWWKMADGSWFHLHVTDDALIGALDYGWFFETEDRRWYYLDPLSGRMHTGWVQVDKKWYCFNEAVPENTWDFNAAIRRWVFGNRDDMPLGALYLSGKTPDGHTVDENGVSADYNGKGGNIAGNMQPGFPTATPSNFLNGMPNFKNGVWEEKRTTAAGTEYTAVGGSF